MRTLPTATLQDLRAWKPCWINDGRRSAIEKLKLFEQQNRGLSFTALDALNFHPWPLPVGAPAPCSDTVDYGEIYHEADLLSDRLWVACHLLPNDLNFTDSLDTWVTALARESWRRDLADPRGPLGPGERVFCILHCCYPVLTSSVRMDARMDTFGTYRRQYLNALRAGLNAFVAGSTDYSWPVVERRQNPVSV